MSENRRYLKVIGIDVDIAPLTVVGPKDKCVKAMWKALDGLRKHVAVVAIVMDRESQALRKVRNDFYAQVQCTTGSQLADGQYKHALYLASPRVFHDTFSYPIDFPFDAKEGKESKAELSELQGPNGTGVFPSLSNLLLASAFREPERYQGSLTFLCNQSRRASEPRNASWDQMVLEDLIAQHRPERCRRFPHVMECRAFNLDRYELKPINWRWLDSEDIRTFTVTRLAQPDSEKWDLQPRSDFFSSAALIIGVDAGAGYDKFIGATVSPDPVPGAVLHALQAVSVQDARHVLYIHSAWTILVDFCVGLFFLIIWKPTLLLINSGLKGTSTSTLLKLVLPPLIGMGLGFICVQYLAPWLLTRNVWANPVYLLAGLVLHAYVESLHGAAHDKDHRKQQPEVTTTPFEARPRPEPCAPAHGSIDFSFGINELCRRRTVGQSGWSVVDALVSLAAQWAVVGYAVCALVHWEGRSDANEMRGEPWRDPGLWHWGGWVALLLAIAVAVSLIRNRRRK
jgi:hypothetical protein